MTYNGVANIPGLWVHRSRLWGPPLEETDWPAGRIMELSPLTLLIIFSLSMLVIPVGGFFVSKAILFEGEVNKDSKSWGCSCGDLGKAINL